MGARRWTWLVAACVGCGTEAVQPPQLAAVTTDYAASGAPGASWTFTPSGGRTLSFGASVITRGGRPVAAEESLLPDGRGVEQGWRFATAPLGTGDVLVRIPVDGLAFVGADAQCLHFRASGDPAGVCYGAATWIDATGRREAIGAAFGDGAITLTVPATIVDDAAYPAVLDPLVSIELGIDTPVPAPTNSHAAWASVDHDGTRSVVAWFDYRVAGRGVYAARVADDGTVVDPDGVLISTSGIVNETGIAWNGAHHLVAWLDAAGVHVAMIDDELAIVVDPYLAAATTPPAGGIRVASDGVGFLVAWQDEANLIRGLRFDAAGAAIDATPLTLTSAVEVGTRVAVAFDGTSYWLAWTAGLGIREVRAGRVRPSDGAPLDGSGFLVGAYVESTPYNTDLACTATTCLVTWQEGGFDCGDCMYPTPYARAARFQTADGAALDGSGFTLEQGRVLDPSPASDGADFLVTWSWIAPGQLTSIVRAARIAALDGAVTDVPALTAGTQGYQRYPRAIGTTAGYLDVWQGSRAFTKVYGARIGAGGVDGPPILVSARREPNSQFQPAAARGTDGWLVAWTDNRDGDYDVYAARVADDGTVLDDPALPIATGDLRDTDPAVAFDGTRYLVVWSANFEMTGRRVELDGTVLDAGGLDVPSGVGITGGVAGPPEVASTGDGWFVTWTDDGKDEWWMKTQVLGARVASDGTVLDTTARPITNEDSFYLHDLAAGANGYMALVGHDDYWSWVDFWSGTVAIADDGTASAPIEVSQADVTSGGTIARAGAGFVALIPDGNLALEGLRLHADGSLLDTRTFAVSPREIGSPDVDDGFAAWSDARYGIAGSRIEPNGSATDPDGVAISVQALAEYPVAVSSDGTGRWLVAYKRSEPPTARVHFRIVEDVDENLSDGSACVASADCQSGVCADGFCCNEPCTESCRACNVAALEGTCTIVATPVRGNRTACETTLACSGVCDGVSPDCQLEGAETACRAAFCQSGWSYPTSVCDGAGHCPYVTPTECALGCDGDGCASEPPPDAAIPDAAIPDAALPDAGIPDAELLDAAIPDAAVLDAAIPDAERASFDAAPAPDAEPPPPPPDGCGCRGGDPGATGTMILLLLTLAATRRSRRA